jgi:phage baseplate assembly protein W
MARNSTRAFLGVGWAFPVKPVNGRLQFAAHEQDVEQAIEILLLTDHAERPMLPQFGGGLRRFVFAPNSPDTRRAIAEAVENAITDWEPRVELKNVEVTASDAEPNLLLIHVDYLVRATNSFYNRVYPFYLLEGVA